MNASLLKRGSKGKDVKALQEMLTAAGYEVPATGTYGAWTERAVKAYQQKSGLKVDGIVGPQTMGSLQPPLPRDNPKRQTPAAAPASAPPMKAEPGEAPEPAGMPEATEPPAGEPQSGLAEMFSGVGGIGSDPDRNQTEADMLPAMNAAAFQNADRRAMQYGLEPVHGTGARVAPPPGAETMGANSMFDEPGVTSYAPPPLASSRTPAYDPLTSMRAPQQSPAIGALAQMLEPYLRGRR